LGIALLVGCAHSPGVPGAPAGSLAQLHVMTAPVGLNLDDRPGVDGFSVKVYANDASNPKTVPIQSGTLEILMFNGTFFGGTNLRPPAKIWTFDSSELKNHQAASSIGTGYDFLLRWETNRPTERLITVLARYHGSDGAILISPASSVTVMDK
jgi:hypothetical protein